MDMVITNLQQQRQVTEQLRREAALKRIMVSKAAEDIMKYVTEHEQEDCLLVGFSSQKSNPFRQCMPGALPVTTVIKGDSGPLQRHIIIPSYGQDLSADATFQRISGSGNMQQGFYRT
ncbi:hypothetical protein KM043_018259 [Ampulex compressa]|nr:hypothetical protein KM043_018259 [Ampulex compressa]